MENKIRTQMKMEVFLSTEDYLDILRSFELKDFPLNQLSFERRLAGLFNIDSLDGFVTLGERKRIYEDFLAWLTIDDKHYKF